MAGAIFAIIAILVIVRNVIKETEPIGNTTGPDVRMKGGIEFQVYQIENGKRVLKMSGDSFTAGDELVYQVSLVKEGHLLVVGLESNGTLYPSYPRT